MIRGPLLEFCVKIHDSSKVKINCLICRVTLELDQGKNVLLEYYSWENATSALNSTYTIILIPKK